jgi:DNA-binding NarL/FixJ family response regulator
MLLEIKTAMIESGHCRKVKVKILLPYRTRHHRGRNKKNCMSMSKEEQLLRETSDENKELVRLLAEGYSVKQIADMKEKKTRTIEIRIERLRARFECPNIAKLIFIFTKYRAIV